MTLIKCRECESDVSDVAISCQKCGHPITPDEKEAKKAVNLSPNGLLQQSLDYVFGMIKKHLDEKLYDKLEVSFNHAIRRNLLDHPKVLNQSNIPREELMDLISASNYLNYKKTGEIYVIPGLLEFSHSTPEKYEKYMKERFEIVKKKFNLPD